MLDRSRKGKRVHLPELAGAVGPELSRAISELLQERTGPGSGEEARDCLRSLRKTALESGLRALQKEIVRCERNGEKEKLAALLTRKQALTKQIMSM
jgi:RNase P/RNase MRP subunit POP5